MASGGVGKRSQILELTPATELGFDGPFDQVVTSFLTLYNPSKKRVCFKVKTTAPRKYCVRPNSGIVEPLSKMSIAIMLQPFDHDSNHADRNKHKFMVQSVVVGNEFGNEVGDINQEALWKSVSSELVMDSKLKCVFHMPNTNTTTTITNNNQTGSNLPSSSETPAGGGQTTTKITSEPGLVTSNIKSTVKGSSQTLQERTTATTSEATEYPLLSSKHDSSNVASQQQQSTTSVSSTATSQTSREPTSWGSYQPPVSTTTNTTTSGTNNTGKYGNPSASSQANLSSGSLNNTSLKSFEEQKATLLIVAFVILVIGIIMGKYII